MQIQFQIKINEMTLALNDLHHTKIVLSINTYLMEYLLTEFHFF